MATGLRFFRVEQDISNGPSFSARSVRGEAFLFVPDARTRVPSNEKIWPEATTDAVGALAGA